MDKKYLILLVGLIFCLAACLSAQDLKFHGKIANTTYSLEKEEVHTRLYQTIRFSVEKTSWNRLTVNTYFRALTDLNETLDNDLRYKFYQFNLQIQKLLGRIDLAAGRLFLHPGTVLGGLDGFQTKFHLTKNISWQLYGGVESHFLRSAKIYESEDGYVAGSLFEWQKLFSSSLQMLYLQKANADDIYWQLAGINLINSSLPHTRLKIQSHYDLKNSRLHKLLFDARYQLGQALFLSMGFKNQYPQVYANSFFTIFEIDPYQKYSLSCSYNLTGSYFANGAYQLIKMDDETANQVILSVSNDNGNIGFIYESGYAGDQLGVMLDYAYAIRPELIASAYIDYSRYRTETVYEYENQLANAVRLSYRFYKRWLVDLEYQWLTNRFKDSDSRILNHIHFNW